MTRQFCDACGQEIQQNYVSTRLKGEHKIRRDGRTLVVAVEVVVGTGPAAVMWNQGDVCRSCVIDAVMSLDTRPQMAEVAR